ncbi:hypothetical protein BDF19DRAFT_431817 [Syncephalis fuscata]|nr:hypothetical protein BDF19DRAFT_431817 [Syncephalis fuscata]
MNSIIVKQLPTNRLLNLVNHLPHNDFYRFILYIGTSVLRLSLSCRLWRGKIIDNPSLWRYLYYHQFLIQAHRVKEWDFVYWCARNGFPIDQTPIESSALLDSLNWYDVYRRRVTTEQNWRHGHLRHSVLSLPRVNTYVDYYATMICATAVLFPAWYKTSDGKTQNGTTIMETVPFSADISHTTVQNIAEAKSTQAMKFLNSYGSLYQQVYLNDRFIIVIQGYDQHTEMEIYTRSDYRKRHTARLPFNSQFVSINGHWALFSYKIKAVDNATRLIVWDLESNQEHSKIFDTRLNSMCIYEATHDAVIIYTLNITDYEHGIIRWALYRFSQNGPEKQLNEGQLQLNVELVPVLDYIDTLSTEFSRIRLGVNIKGYNRMVFIHTILLTRNMDIGSDYLQRISRQVTSIAHENKFYCQLLTERDSKLVFNDRLDWSAVTQYRHIIGNLFLITELQDVGLRHILIDINNGEIIRQIDGHDIDNHTSFLMTGIITISGTRMLMSNYGAA